MRRAVRTACALVAAVIVFSIGGCATSAEVSEGDMRKNNEAFSQAEYEKAMRAQGKGAELDAEKARASERNAQEEGQH